MQDYLITPYDPAHYTENADGDVVGAFGPTVYVTSLADAMKYLIADEAPDVVLQDVACLEEKRSLDLQDMYVIVRLS